MMSMNRMKKYEVQGWIRLGGLMLACSYVHARNDRGYRYIQAVVATRVLPREAIKNAFESRAVQTPNVERVRPK